MKSFKINYQRHYITGPFAGKAIADSTPATDFSLSVHLAALNSRTEHNPGIDFYGEAYYISDIVVEEQKR